MIKTITVILFSLFIAGCSVEDKLNIAKGKSICHNNGGIYSAYYDYANGYTFAFNDGLNVINDSDELSNYNNPLVSKHLKGEIK